MQKSDELYISFITSGVITTYTNCSKIFCNFTRILLLKNLKMCVCFVLGKLWDLFETDEFALFFVSKICNLFLKGLMEGFLYSSSFKVHNIVHIIVLTYYPFIILQYTYCIVKCLFRFQMYTVKPPKK